MSITQIEAELQHLSASELRRLALNSWAAYVQKERGDATVNECGEDDPRLLAALDDALVRADRAGAGTATGDEVRARIDQWTTK